MVVELEARPARSAPLILTKADGRSASHAHGAGTANVAVPARPASCDILDAVVKELNDVSRTGTMDVFMKLGRVVLSKLYAGNLDAWRAHGPKEISFRRLVDRTDRDLAVSAASLYRAVALCELTDRMGVSTWKHLSVSHLRAVLGLPDHEQRRLLTIAEKSAWTVERVEGEAARLRHTEGGRRGRRALPAFVKTVRRLGKLLRSPTQSLAGLDQLNQVDDEEVLSLHKIVSDARQQLDGLEKQLLSHGTTRDRRR